MVAYGSSLQLARRRGWENAYLNYDLLKAHIEEMEAVFDLAQKRIAHTIDDNQDLLNRYGGLGKAFQAALHREIEKVSLFVLKRQGEVADMMGALKFSNSINSQEQQQQRPLLSSSIVETGQGAAAAVTIFDSRELLSLEKIALNDPMQSYAVVGVELLHLLRFICVNAIGIRKILKKYSKIMSRIQVVHYQSEREASLPSAHNGFHLLADSFQAMTFPGTNTLVAGDADSHLQQLANSASINALNASLSRALIDCSPPTSTISPTLTISSTPLAAFAAANTMETSLLRFQCVIATVERLREDAKVVNEPFGGFLARKAMIVTGDNDLGGMQERALRALDELLHFEPADILEMSRAELVEWYGLSHSYARTPKGVKGSKHVRTPSVHGGKHVRRPSIESIAPPDDEGDQAWGGVDSVSLFINLLSTLLYTVNYYIIAPTANHYAIALGTDGAFGATLVGAASFSALFGAFLYSFWLTKSSFQSALIFSSICPLIGNLLYAVAISYNSMPIAIGGRILCGFGSAEVANRQLIAACVSFRGMTRASALFVATGAVGMSFGPLLAAILEIAAGRDTEVDFKLPFFTPAGGIIFNHVTSPGFVMSGLWFLQLLALIFLFQEPERINGSEATTAVATDSDDSGDEDDDVPKLFRKKVDSLTTYGTGNVSEVEVPKIHSGAVILHNVTTEAASTFGLIFRNPALPLTMCLFGYIELVDEVLISSCSMICKRYFSWHGSTAGFLIASLGALVLPADFVVERASRVFEERRIMKYSVVFIFCSLLAMVNYEGLLFDIVGSISEELDPHVQQAKEVSIGRTPVTDYEGKGNEFPYDWAAGPFVYIASLSAVFMGTIILEGVDTSVMNKATPSELNEQFLNGGLLATLIGTLGRVLADSMITVSALLDMSIFVDFVNATFSPILVLAVLGYLMVKRFYKYLQ